jgi:hypothetical protein
MENGNPSTFRLVILSFSHLDQPKGSRKSHIIIKKERKDENEESSRLLNLFLSVSFVPLAGSVSYQTLGL